MTLQACDTLPSCLPSSNNPSFALMTFCSVLMSMLLSLLRGTDRPSKCQIKSEYFQLIALGVMIDGTKTPLGIWAGSTENTTVVTELLSNLVGRGLRVEQPMLFVIDGGKAIRR